MNSLQKKALKRVLELLKAFSSYEIYRAISDSTATIEDKELRKNILDRYGDAMNGEAKKVTEAQSWIEEVLNNE